MFCAYARDTGSIEDQPKESRKWEFIRTISDLVAHTHLHTYMYLVNWNYKNYEKKVTIIALKG